VNTSPVKKFCDYFMYNIKFQRSHYRNVSTDPLRSGCRSFGTHGAHFGNRCSRALSFNHECMRHLQVKLVTLFSSAWHWKCEQWWILHLWLVTVLPVPVITLWQQETLQIDARYSPCCAKWITDVMLAQVWTRFVQEPAFITHYDISVWDATWLCESNIAVCT
jgi:hypothetical protein